MSTNSISVAEAFLRNFGDLPVFKSLQADQEKGRRKERAGLADTRTRLIRDHRGVHHP